MMFRGTTPTLYFKINNIDDLTTIKELSIVFKTQLNKYCCHQDGKKMIKTLKDVVIDAENHIISLDLSQKDTLSLQAPIALVQIKFMFNDDKVCASTICELPVENPLDDKIMKVITTNPENNTPETDPNPPESEGTEPENPDDSDEEPEVPGTEDEETTTPDENGDDSIPPTTDEDGDETDEIGG